MRALAGALAAGLLPGYFWAGFLCRTSGLAERLAYSAVLSMASVPVVALLLARVARGGITLWAAAASAVIVLASGAVAARWRGPAPGSADPVLRPPAIRDGRALALVVIALALVLASMLGAPSPRWLLLVIAAVLVLAGALTAWPAGPAAGADSGPDPEAGPAAGADGGPGPAGPAARPVLHSLALATVLALTAFRAYSGVVRHDWPYLRGSDQFSYVVMAGQLLSHGSYRSFLVYPPGFAAMTAVICRLSGLSPLALYPVLAPALLVLTALGAYALATRLWGTWYGIAAAALSGLVLIGPFQGFEQGRYPDLIGAFFLMIMAVAALITLYASPSARSGALVTVIGASVVLYHPVASLYLVLLLISVALIGLPYLLVQRCRDQARVLALALAALALLSAAYAWYIYGLGEIAGGGSATSRAVGIAIGSQAPLSPGHVLAELSPPILWLGVFGGAALAVSVRRLRPPQVLAAVTVLTWCALLYAGSRTSIDGFPKRFERDLGGPLAVLSAFGLCLVVRSLSRWRAPPWRVTAVVAVVAAVATAMALGTAGLQADRNIRIDGRAAHRGLLTPQDAAAGTWLRQHNTGGTIISTPGLNRGLTNRAVLAMGGYAGLQSYFSRRIAHPRSLPPAGRRPLLDSQAVLLQPASCQAAGIIGRDNVRYVVLYKFGQDADLAGFLADTARYRRVYQNPSVVIYAPSATAGPACPRAR